MKVMPLEGTTMTVPELVRLAEGGAVILTRDGQPLVSVRAAKAKGDADMLADRLYPI